MRNRLETVYALGLGVLAVGYTVMAFTYDFGALSRPGPGFVPVIIGVGLTACVVALFLIGGRPRRSTESVDDDLESEPSVEHQSGYVATRGQPVLGDPATQDTGTAAISIKGVRVASDTTIADGPYPPSSRESLLRPLLILAIAAGFVIGLPYIGFIAGIFLMTSLSATVLGVRWWRAIALGVGSAIFTYFVFDRWLLVPFPSGVFALG